MRGRSIAKDWEGRCAAQLVGQLCCGVAELRRISKWVLGGGPDALLLVPRPLSTLEVVHVAFHRSIALDMHVVKMGGGASCCAGG